jgi:hypothetical protein
MIIPKLSQQQIIGTLRATGSTDPDVLFAKKEELLQETKRLKLLGIVPLIAGTILTASIVGAIVGIPMLIVGYLVRKTYNQNIEISEEAFALYLRSVAPVSE